MTFENLEGLAILGDDAPPRLANQLMDHAGRNHPQLARFQLVHHNRRPTGIAEPLQTPGQRDDVAVSLAFGAFRIEAYERDPAPERMWRFGRWPPPDIQYRFLSTRFRALDRNRRKLERKARLTTSSLTGFSMLASVVAIVAVLDLVR